MLCSIIPANPPTPCAAATRGLNQGLSRIHSPPSLLPTGGTALHNTVRIISFRLFGCTLCIGSYGFCEGSCPRLRSLYSSGGRGCAGRWILRGTPCTGSLCGRARRCPRRHSLCTRTSYDCACRFGSHRILCSGSSDAGAGRCWHHHNLCIGSECDCARTHPFHRSPCTGF